MMRTYSIVLTTNQIDTILLKDKDMLRTYKEQSSSESGFVFIKNTSMDSGEKTIISRRFFLIDRIVFV